MSSAITAEEIGKIIKNSKRIAIKVKANMPETRLYLQERKNNIDDDYLKSFRVKTT
ncbi:hypothetical protein J4232_05350 [Candidatus Woesearchaeota archaeon]|nr:hypothetical protein [Candidatus Woesearchaeota archaeon]